MFNKENIMQIEFTSRIGGCEVQKIALFNKNNVSENEAIKVIRTEGIYYNPKVIIIYKEQFENVFFE
jgi:hypothetical protein